MNERMLELRRQAIEAAAESCPGNVPFDPKENPILWDRIHISYEKFAELIVRECAGLFEIEWGDEKLTGNDVGYVVKKHFGVEE